MLYHVLDIMDHPPPPPKRATKRTVYNTVLLMNILVVPRLGSMQL